jgi:hypothetical protein
VPVTCTTRSSGSLHLYTTRNLTRNVSVLPVVEVRGAGTGTPKFKLSMFFRVSERTVEPAPGPPGGGPARFLLPVGSSTLHIRVPPSHIPGPGLVRDGHLVFAATARRPGFYKPCDPSPFKPQADHRLTVCRSHAAQRPRASDRLGRSESDSGLGVQAP